MAGRAAGLVLAGLLGGCAALNPAGWFHRQEGGVIAQQHGPLPGASQPYPNLATVPPPPAPPDLAQLNQINTGLMADRAHARLLAEATPLPDPSRPSTAPGLFGVGSLPPPVVPPAGGMASASMDAVTAPPAPVAAAPARPPAPPAKAPVTAVRSAALPPAMPAAAATTGPAAAGVTRTARVAGASTGTSGAAEGAAEGAAGGASAGGASAGAAPAGAAPAIPAAPPPMPQVAQAGVAASAAAGRSASGTAPPPPPVSGPAADRVTVAFAPGSAVLPTAALPDLRALAARRGGRAIEALGQGAAASADPTAQLAATKLGLARAQAIAAALEAAGVPAAAIQLRADASGAGGSARLE
ncbi:MAG: hypothetical protein HIU82_10935 [Proteobacteria bacterium]|nr:hypothetical protein [Pseudomonadota bacterium]